MNIIDAIKSLQKEIRIKRAVWSNEVFLDEEILSNTWWSSLKTADLLSDDWEIIDELKDITEEDKQKIFKNQFDRLTNIIKTAITVDLEDIKKELKILLKDQTQGLQTIIHLIQNKDKMNIDFLNQVFPWINPRALASDNPATLKDWLINNYSSDIVENFLNEKIKKQGGQTK